MDVISQEKRLQTENKKLNREIKRLKKDNEVLRIANDQASRTQAYIQKDSMRQLFYNNQLLKTYPYLLILTDEQLLTVMSSDVLFRYSCRYDREEIRRGVPIQNVLTGVLPKYDLSILLEKCGEALAGAAVPPHARITCEARMASPSSISTPAAAPFSTADCAYWCPSEV